MVKHMKSQKREWKMHQQLQKREEDNPIPSTTKNDLPSMGKMKPTPKNVEGKAQKKLQLPPKREES